MTDNGNKTDRERFMSCFNRFQSTLGKQPRDMYTNTKEAAKVPKQQLWGINVSNKDKRLLVVMFPHKKKKSRRTQLRLSDDCYKTRRKHGRLLLYPSLHTKSPERLGSCCCSLVSKLRTRWENFQRG